MKDKPHPTDQTPRILIINLAIGATLFHLNALIPNQSIAVLTNETNPIFPIEDNAISLIGKANIIDKYESSRALKATLVESLAIEHPHALSVL